MKELKSDCVSKRHQKHEMNFVEGRKICCMKEDVELKKIMYHSEILKVKYLVYFECFGP